MKSPRLTEGEVKALCAALARGQNAWDEADMLAVITWATEYRMGALVVDMALQGDIGLCVEQGVVKVHVRTSREELPV